VAAAEAEHDLTPANGPLRLPAVHRLDLRSDGGWSEGSITKLDPGSRALRYMVGFGAGAAKAQAETRLIDVQTDWS
jgi:hypothetical protein